MPRSCLTLVSLVTYLVAATGLAETPEEFGLRPLPPVDAPLETPLPPPSQSPASPSPTPPSQDPGLASGETPAPGPAINLNGSAPPAPVASLSDFVGYRYATSSLDWLPGGGDQFGMFSIVSDHYKRSGIGGGIGLGFGVHFLDGPVDADMPPRLYDFSVGYQLRRQVGPLAFDLSTAVMARSDFEGSAREGIRFPSHAVGFLTVRPPVDLVFGIDYLHRGDVMLLPVAGLIWKPDPEIRFELVFPRPRAVFQLTERYRLYLAGELGGGTWAIERVALGNDLASYRDLRASLGLEFGHKGGGGSAFEIGYAFDRRLEYASRIGDMPLDDAVVLRLITAF